MPSQSLNTISTLTLALLSACQLTVQFELVAIEETDADLCSDGRDNDFDGLTDCQDWSCVDQLPCCDIPEVVFIDDFESGPESCAASECTEAICSELTCGPDAMAWHTWPCPFPKQCDGGLRLEKTTNFASGVLSEVEVALNPGLLVDVDIKGRPELHGYVELALTLQDKSDLAGSLDPTGSDQEIMGFAALRQRYTQAGYQLVALSQGVEIGTSPEVTTADASHTISLGLDRNRVAFFELDGEVFAATAEPIPVTTRRARIALSGLTEQVVFEAVRVQAGLRCPDPLAWGPAAADTEASVVLAPDGSGFDADEVYHPAVRVGDEGLELYYTGCMWKLGTSECFEFENVGIGRALGSETGEYQRDGMDRWLKPDDFPSAFGIYPEMSIDVLSAEPLRAIAAPTADSGVYMLDENLQPDFEAVLRDRPNCWYSRYMCCASLLEHPDGTTYIWYAGLFEDAVDTWHIGVATSTDGVSFDCPNPDPVLSPGSPESFDSESLLSPTVVYDAELGLFRMWYQGRDYFGETAIGYAVSIDGVEWHKSPHNPVLVPADLGLSTIGGPEVLLSEDGRLRAWVHGTTGAEPRRRIFALTNEGRLIEGEED